MSFEVVTFTAELEKLDMHHTQLRSSYEDLRVFILSPTFLHEPITFETRLSDFQAKLVTLVETVQAPVPSLPQMPFQLPSEPEEATLEDETEESSGKIGLAKAVVLMFALAACAIAVINDRLPAAVLIVVVAVVVTFLFLPQIRKLLAGLLSKKYEDKEEKEEKSVEDWISDSLSRIRDRYVSARFLLKFQTSDKASLPDYALPGVDEAVYNRRLYFAETLPSDFLSHIGRIIVTCDKNVWNRRTLLINAITLSRQATAAAKT